MVASLILMRFAHHFSGYTREWNNTSQKTGRYGELVGSWGLVLNYNVNSA